MEAEWQGRRVSVRRVVERTEDGRLLQADVVGELVGLDAQTAVVRARDGLVEVPLALVTAARLVTPSTRDELDLQVVASQALRAAETLDLGGWLLRTDPARPRRANSVLPHAQLAVPLDEALERARDWYAARGRPVLFQIPYPARRLLDSALDERGWTYEAPSLVLSAPLAPLTAGDEAGDGGHGGPGDSGPSGRSGRSGRSVRLDPAPDAPWLALADGDEALLTRHDTVAFASVRDDSGAVLGVARGTVDDGWLGLTNLAVAQDARRRGVARRLVRALAGWAGGHGAQLSFTQTVADNAAARELFAGLGYRQHHEYHYRSAP